MQYLIETNDIIKKSKNNHTVVEQQLRDKLKLIKLLVQVQSASEKS